MAQVIILRGVSGAGKSALAEEMFCKANKGVVSSGGSRTIVVSADHYMLDENEEYAFDFSRLQECHGKCLTRYVNLVQHAAGNNGIDAVIVDNTNGSLWEVSPYAQLALAYGHRLKVITLICDPAVAAGRSIHGTPASIILAKDLQIRKTAAKMSSRWNQEIRFVQ
jgi:hypothetical protein